MITSYQTQKTLIVGSNANNSSKAGVSYFNSNNGVSNSQTKTRFNINKILHNVYIQYISLPLGKKESLIINPVLVTLM